MLTILKKIVPANLKLGLLLLVLDYNWIRLITFQVDSVIQIDKLPAFFNIRYDPRGM